jgi:hypothetical protein
MGYFLNCRHVGDAGIRAPRTFVRNFMIAQWYLKRGHFNSNDFIFVLRMVAQLQNREIDRRRLLSRDAARAFTPYLSSAIALLRGQLGS